MGSWVSVGVGDDARHYCMLCQARVEPFDRHWCEQATQETIKEVAAQGLSFAPTDPFCCWRRRNGSACPCPQATGAALDAAARDPMDLAGAMNDAFERAWVAGKPAILADPPMLRCGHAHFPTVQPPSWLDDRCRDAIRGAWCDHYATDPTLRTEEPTALDRRTAAEQQVAPLLEDDGLAALAYYLLRNAKWDDDRARRVLREKGLWL